ncbi:unnamed protein product [Aspergillus oryzae RIB40]|uniref:DNA, SC103 n=2 Tax=Aspergillus oryzae TaxID=5062 RepID=Q2TYM8_ASPOR|nr:unnamed protein product [Aspergillus oryzae RIB40]EIT73623.1 hypothetical protein Ao3042_10456 [Aspergillus oryzae 3.042]KDE78612.1 hypothetical protein AO1008_04881 [Aspergillus oryzae 100-8]BAE65645.1 unnamed protein product [Aspergillus oryzae RIB40]|eukprot:EIT73623.1 hypothetical protein Ao3042_10456 [Aspergillus oryzae 3.042]
MNSRGSIFSKFIHVFLFWMKQGFGVSLPTPLHIQYHYLFCKLFSFRAALYVYTLSFWSFIPTNTISTSPWKRSTNADSVIDEKLEQHSTIVPSYSSISKQKMTHSPKHKAPFSSPTTPPLTILKLAVYG